MSTVTNTNPSPGPISGSDPRWAAVLARDPQADGTFYYAVRTTGVYCRPSCASRRAKPEHVLFFPTRATAEQAGFRPCLRCKPEQPSLASLHAEKVAAACRQIEASERPPNLAQLAGVAKLSPFHFHRLFRGITGLTPKAYAAAHRAKRVRTELRRSATVTAAIFDAGFESGGQFYANSNRLLGMRPSDYRAGGRDAKIHFAIGQCSLGAILVAKTAKGICAILLGDDADSLVRELQDRFAQAKLIGGDAEFEQWVAKVVGLVEQPAVGLDLPLDVRGTAFQMRVWQALVQIPSGTTATYTEIARRIGAPKSARAVAQACAANPLAVAIPCHRVVRNDGALSGYRWGVARKRTLLDREAG
ncbi:MAG TPA: bifunctional DNA-binding transcriptional regulator/O6-methylguanine-DNA methyltransferase Ada [Steroidobacteraceae bacterium]